jgi:hypothetical protein
MNAFAPNDYGPVFRPFLESDRRRPLGAGRPVDAIRGRLAQLTMEDAFAPGLAALDRQMAGCCLSAVWLVHDFLDEAHAICQDIPTSSGSYWHAIMHRREGDYSNAKYWLRRVEQHEAFSSFAARTAELAAFRGQSRTLEKLVRGGAFDPFAFVDLVEKAVRSQQSDDIELCLDIQQAEWETLFDWCYQQANGVTT